MNFYIVKPIQNYDEPPTYQELDITNFVENYNIELPSLNIEKGNIILPSISIEINQKGYKPIQDFVLSNNNALFFVKEGNNIVFVGFLDENFQNSFDSKHFSTTIKVSHIGTKLRKEKISINIISNSFRQVIEEVIRKTTLNNLLVVDVNDITGNIQAYDTDIPAITILEKIAMRYGVIIYFEGLKIKSYPLDYTANESGVITSFKSIKKGLQKNNIKQVVVKTPIYKQDNEERVIWYSTYKQSENAVSECLFWVYPQKYIFDGEVEISLDKSIRYVFVNSLKVFFTANNSNIIATQNGPLHLEKLEYVEKENKIILKVKSNFNWPVVITKFRIIGKAVYIDKDVVVASTVDMNETTDFNVNTYPSENIEDIQQITDKIAFLLKISKYIITTEHYNDVNIPLGGVYKLLDIPTNTNTKAICISKQIQTTGFLYKWLPLENYIPSSDFLINVIPTSSIQPVKPPEDIQQETYQQVIETLASNEGINEHGFTNIPSDFTANDIILRTQFRFVIIQVRKQQNLINFHSYEIQYRKHNTTQWQPQEPIAFYTENITLKLDFDTIQENGNSIPVETTYDIRIRRKTRANLYSGWYVFTITLNPSNANELVVDSIFLDNNNFWLPNGFKVGNENNYIQFINNQLEVVNAQTRLLNNGLVVENGLTNTTITNEFITTTGFIEAGKGYKLNGLYYKFYRFELNHNITSTIEFKNLLIGPTGSKHIWKIFIPFYNIYMIGMKYNERQYIQYFGNPFVMIGETFGNLKVRMDSIVSNIVYPTWQSTNYIEIFVEVWGQNEPNVFIEQTTETWLSMNTDLFYQSFGNYIIDLTGVVDKTILIPYYQGANISYILSNLAQNEIINFRKFFWDKATSYWVFENQVWDMVGNKNEKVGQWYIEIQGNFLKTTHGHLLPTSSISDIYGTSYWIDGNRQFQANYATNLGTIYLYDGGDTQTNVILNISVVRRGNDFITTIRKERVGTGWNKYSIDLLGNTNGLRNGINRWQTQWASTNGRDRYVIFSVRKSG